jgi:glyceraldehyde 3-phosphate dehydrogenase
MKATAIKDPTLLPHKELGVDIVMECTGIFEAAQEGGTLMLRTARTLQT